MTTSTLRALSPATAARRAGWFSRLAAHLRAPSIRDLDAATLRDIGASAEARAEADLRDAYRHWFSPSRWHGF
jgi:hypothetical protein